MTQQLLLRPMASKDFGDLHTWLNRPHVVQWWGGKQPTLAEVDAEYTPQIQSGSTVHTQVIELGGRPIGWFQWYRLGDEPGYAPELALPADGVAADLAIGDPDLLGQGVGRATLGLWLETVVAGLEPPAPVAYIDPDPMNTRAVDCYRSVGFEPTGDLLPDPDMPGSLRLLMRLDLAR